MLTDKLSDPKDYLLEAPRSRKALLAYLLNYLGLRVPSQRVCEEHNRPLDYLWYSYSGDMSKMKNRSRVGPKKIGDCVVWANRGGGKTLLAAVATLLDCLFKPGCETRILGGSGEQARRLYEYLALFLNRGFDRMIEGPVLKSRCRFENGSRVEVLTQSPTSVRGQHVQKLRCDEIELFDADVYAAAQYTTHSTDSIRSSLEILSTMHRPYGLMQKVITRATENGTPVFKWCLWEVIEKCRGRTCSQCPLWTDCGGKARRADGYLHIDDCIAQMRRSSRAGWESEMLCLKPSLENIVFAEFSEDVHVNDMAYDPNCPLYRSIDFGYVNPFVCLWIQTDSSGVIRVIDEYVRTRATIHENAQVVKEKTQRYGVLEEKVAHTYCDPSGGQATPGTGTSQRRELRAAGIRASGRPTRILDGVEHIRRALRSGEGQKKLIVSPRCPRLIESLQCYHYPDDIQNPSETPYKDGVYDHAIDALRYFFVNVHPARKVRSRAY